jgi:hypothetical protein
MLKFMVNGSSPVGLTVPQPGWIDARPANTAPRIFMGTASARLRAPIGPL